MRDTTHTAAPPTVIKQLSEHSGERRPQKVQSDQSFCFHTAAMVKKAVIQLDRGQKIQLFSRIYNSRAGFNIS